MNINLALCNGHDNNDYIDYTMADRINDHREIMVKAFPDDAFALMPVLLPIMDPGMPVFEVWWPVTQDGIQQFVTVTPDGDVIYNEFLPAPETF